MKIFVKTGDNRQQKVRRYPATQVVIVMANFGLGLASIFGVYQALLSTSIEGAAFWALLTVVSFIAMSVALTPVMMAGPWADAKPLGKVFGLFIVSGFMILDGGFQLNAINQGNQMLNADKIEKAQTRYNNALAKLEAVPTPDAAGAIRRAETYAATVAALEGQLDKADAHLTEAKALGIPVEWIMAGLMLVQIATFCGRAWIASTSNARQADLDAAVAETKGEKSYSEKAVKGLITKALNEERAKTKGPKLAVSN